MSYSRAWHTGDTPTLKITVKNSDDGSIVNITGHTVKFHYWYGDEPATVGTGELLAAASGTAQFVWTSPGIPKPGLLKWRWVVDDGAGKSWTSERTFTKTIGRFK